MRIILDTNILLSSLMTKATPPDRLYEAWKSSHVMLVSSEQQIEELRRVTRRPGVQERIAPAEAGRMINDLRLLAKMLEQLPLVELSPDPMDNFLLAMAQAGDADLLVTGDKRGLLNLVQYGRTRIVTARAALTSIGEL
jgi:uncharacterized protein